MSGSNRRSKGRESQRPTAKKTAAARAPSKSPRSAPAGRPAASGNDGKLQFVIPSDFAAGRKVQKRIVDGVTRLGYGAHSVFAIKLALEEALINAIKHGNKFDPGKRVRIEAKLTPAQVDITIEDEGPGFARTDVPDPTLEENLEKCSGRGILLIEAYMTRVRYAKGGRRVRMIKKNEREACVG